jgi:transcriptional regulator
VSADLGIGGPDNRLPFLVFCLFLEMTPCASTRCRVYVEVIGMTAPSKFDLPQGTLDLLILRVVALGPIHGYAIAQHIQMISKEALQIQQGSLYPALHRLENRNFLAAEWGPTETGREAKFYRLTAKGRTQLKTETESWERLAELVTTILKDPLGGHS